MHPYNVDLPRVVMHVSLTSAEDGSDGIEGGLAGYAALAYGAAYGKGPPASLASPSFSHKSRISSLPY